MDRHGQSRTAWPRLNANVQKRKRAPSAEDAMDDQVMINVINEALRPQILSTAANSGSWRGMM